MAIARRSLQGLPDDFQERGIAELARIYREAAELIKRRAEQRLISDARTLTVEASRARALLVEIEAILQDLDMASAEVVSAMIPNAYRRGVRRVTEGLREIGFSTKLTTFDGRFHANAIQLLMLDMQDSLSEGIVGMGKQFRVALRRTQLSRNLDKKITEDVATAFVSRQTRRELSKGITKTILDEFGAKPLLINGRKYNIEKYAELVARTKSREAVTAGFVNRMVETGNDLVMVTDHGATDACGLYEGKVFSISGADDRYPSVSSLPNSGPPFHPNSHVAGTIIADYESVAASSRKFHGQVVTIKTAGGNKTTITANHPIATRVGFVPAKALKVGDSILCGRSAGHISFAPNKQHGPTEITELLKLCDESGEFILDQMPVRSEDFNGEGMEGEVAIIRLNRHFLDKQISHGLQAREEGEVVMASADSAPAECGLSPGFDAVHSHEPRDGLSGSIRSSHGTQATGGAGPSGFGRLSGLGNDSSGFPVSSHDQCAPDAFMDIGSGRSEYSGYPCRAYPGEIKPDRVTSIDIREFLGYVYCLESASGLYTADGILVKNCTHNFAPFVESLASGAEKRRGEGVPEVALNKTFAEVQKAVGR
jgi:predicted transcriptional regulator